jgi:hypothetical protein
MSNNKVLGNLEVRRVGVGGGGNPFGRLIRIERGPAPPQDSRLSTAPATTPSSISHSLIDHRPTYPVNLFGCGD